MAAAAVSSRLTTGVQYAACGSTESSVCSSGSQRAFLANPIKAYGRGRKSQVVCMAGHGHGHEEKPKEPEFKPSGWYEKDILEYRAKYTTAGEGEFFEFGIEDGHHTWHEGDDGEFVDEVKKAFETSGAPTGFAGFLAASFLPILFALIFLGIDDTYWLIFTAIWTVTYGGIQMTKPGEEFNEEPARYRRVYDPPETKPEPWSNERLGRGVQLLE